MSLDVVKSLTRAEVGTKDNFRPCYRRVRAPFLVIINELISIINDMIALTTNIERGRKSGLERELPGMYQEYVGVMVQKDANEA